jgi:hypothetical protein
MKLRRTTKMAYQAAIAIALAELLNMYFYVERGYWIVLTAMVLTTQTWGESVKRAFERVGMTALGGAVGTALYFCIPANQSNMFLFLVLFSVFFAVYMAKIQYFISMFFLTFFVVFLFALINEWDLHLLRARIIDTVLGAVIALVVGGVFFTQKTNVTELFVGYLQKLKALISSTFDTKSRHKALITGRSLLVDFQIIKNSALAIRYELLFHRLNRNDFNSLLNQVAFCTQCIVNLIEAYHWMLQHLTNEECKMIDVAVQTTQYNLDVLILRLQHNKQANILSADNLPKLVSKDIADDASRFASLESDALGFFNLMYFFTQLNKHLNAVYSAINKAY